VNRYDLAASLVGSAAGAVVQALGAHGDRADAAGHSQHASLAGAAPFLVPAHGLVNGKARGGGLVSHLV